MRRMIVTSLTTAVLAGCSGAAEQPILNQLFTASRLHDTTTLNGFSMVELDPQRQGSVISFSIVSVTPESSRRRLALQSLAKALDDAKAEDAAFNKRHEEYALQHSETVAKIVKAGRDTKLKGSDAEIQAAWFKMVDEGRDISRKVSELKRAIAKESAVAERSVADPRNPIDVTRLDGEIASKEVTVDANVRLPSGGAAKKRFLVTMQRAFVKGPKGDITGRWIVTSVKDASTAPGAKSS
jgi:hypothetical protein